MTNPGSPAPEPHIERIESTRDLQALAREWNPLLQATSSNNLFLTWEWVLTWWQVYGADCHPYVLVARAGNGTLVGIAPLYRVPGRLLGWTCDIVRFIGSGNDVTPEHLSFIIRPGWETAVLGAFARSLTSDSRVKVVDLRPFTADSPHLEGMATLLGKGSGRVDRKPYSACPVFALPASVEEFQSNRSKNYRKKIGEYERRCDRLHARVRLTTTRRELERDMPAFVALHQKRWGGRSRAFRSASYAAFHAKLAPRLLERGWLRLFVFETESTAIAALYCFSYAGRYSFYQSGRNPDHDRERVGLVLMHRVIQSAIAEGARTFDFLRGREDYKYRWATENVVSEQLLYCTSPAARLVLRLRAALPASRL